MALGSKILKVELSVADMDNDYYASHALTVAQHPSETSERVMVRLIAFALYANDMLSFGRGLATDDEPDLWLRDLTGSIDLWIDVGLPDERRMRQSCGRARQVVVLAYGGAKLAMWWKKNERHTHRLANLTVLRLNEQELSDAAQFVARAMTLNFTIQDGQILLAAQTGAVNLSPDTLKSQD